jgi:hypothetical protein
MVVPPYDPLITGVGRGRKALWKNPGYCTMMVAFING